MTKSNMSSLYQGKPGKVGIASMYPLYGIGIPCPFEKQQTLQWKDPQPKFHAEPFGEGRYLGPNIHQHHHLHPLCHDCSLIGMANQPYQGTRVIIARFDHLGAHTY